MTQADITCSSHRDARARAHKHTHTHKHLHRAARARTHTHTHTHTHKHMPHTHTNTHTHTHTHTRIGIMLQKGEIWKLSIITKTTTTTKNKRKNTASYLRVTWMFCKPKSVLLLSLLVSLLAVLRTRSVSNAVRFQFHIRRALKLSLHRMAHAQGLSACGKPPSAPHWTQTTRRLAAKADLKTWGENSCVTLRLHTTQILSLIHISEPTRPP